MKKFHYCILLYLLGASQIIAFTQSLHISLRYQTVGTPLNAEYSEITDLKGKYEDVDFSNVNHPVLRNAADLRVQKLYKNNRLQQMSMFKNSSPDQVLARFDFEYEGEQLQRINELSLQLNHKTFTYEMMLNKTSKAIYKNGYLVRETVHNQQGELMEQYDYKAPTEFNGFPLIQYTHTNFDPEAAVKKTRHTLQYDDEGLAFYYTISRKDTVYSLERKWVSPDSYENLLVTGNNSRKYRVKNYWDLAGNLSMSISQETDNIGKEANSVFYREIKYIAGTIDYEAGKALAAKRAARPTIVPSIPAPVEVIAAYEPITVEEITPPTEDPNRAYKTYELSEIPVFQPDDPDGLKFFEANIKYPEFAKRNSIMGTVYVSYVIEKDGSLSNITIKRDIGGGCGDEVVRMLKSMSQWTPGRYQGKAVRVEMVNPFRFKL